MKNIAHTVVGQLLEDGASTRREILRRLDRISQRPDLSAVAAQLALSRVIPDYVMDDPDDPWWSSASAAQLLAELKDILHPASQHGVKPGGPTRCFPEPCRAGSRRLATCCKIAAATCRPRISFSFSTRVPRRFERRGRRKAVLISERRPVLEKRGWPAMRRPGTARIVKQRSKRLSTDSADETDSNTSRIS